MSCLTAYQAAVILRITNTAARQNLFSAFGPDKYSIIVFGKEKINHILYHILDNDDQKINISEIIIRKML
jgi:hypothetical protein